MVKICPKCSSKNPDESFWCQNCNSKLIKKRNPKEKNYLNETETLYEDKLSKSYYFSILKIPFAIILVAIIIFASYHVVTNIGKGTFDMDRFTDYPWDETYLPWDNNNFPWIEGLNINNIQNSYSASYDFTDIGEINEDYWFEGDTIKTKTGWTFTVSEEMDCNYQAKILEYYVYNKDAVKYEPSEIISPLDIFFGFDDIINNPEKYPYKIETHFYRGVYVTCYGSSTDQAYFMNHVTNTHLIPHSKEVQDQLTKIKTGEIVTLSGNYVNLHGTHQNDNTQYTWSTDTVIGNYDCEIILIDSFTIN